VVTPPGGVIGTVAATVPDTHGNVTVLAYERLPGSPVIPNPPPTFRLKAQRYNTKLGWSPVTILADQVILGSNRLGVGPDATVTVAPNGDAVAVVAVNGDRPSIHYATYVAAGDAGNQNHWATDSPPISVPEELLCVGAVVGAGGVGDLVLYGVTAGPIPPGGAATLTTRVTLRSAVTVGRWTPLVSPEATFGNRPAARFGGRTMQGCFLPNHNALVVWASMDGLLIAHEVTPNGVTQYCQIQTLWNRYIAPVNPREFWTTVSPDLANNRLIVAGVTYIQANIGLSASIDTFRSVCQVGGIQWDASAPVGADPALLHYPYGLPLDSPVTSITCELALGTLGNFAVFGVEVNEIAEATLGSPWCAVYNATFGRWTGTQRLRGPCAGSAAAFDGSGNFVYAWAETDITGKVAFEINVIEYSPQDDRWYPMKIIGAISKPYTLHSLTVFPDATGALHVLYSWHFPGPPEELYYADVSAM
jgi:hypothetical protein